MSLKRSGVPSALLKPLVLALGLAGLQAHAEDLIEIYNAARAYDAGYLSAKASADSAQYRAAQADRLVLPTVGMSGSINRGDTNVPVAGTLGYTNSQLGVTGSQPLFNPGNKAALKEAYKQLDQAKADLDTAEQDLIVRVAQAYFDVLAAQDTLGTTRASKTAITEQLASAKRNFEVGTATITDTREAQARYDLSVADELAAENDLRTKRITLDTLVGRANVQPNPLVTPTPLPPIMPPDPEHWVQVAQAVHPTIRKAAIGVDIAGLETERARAGNLPTVDLVGSVGTTHGSGAGAASPGTYKQAQVGVQFNLPLFAGFSVQNAIKEKLVLQDKAHDDLEAARRGVAQATRTAFFGLQSGQSRVRALEAAQSSSKLSLEATQLGYKVGVRVNLDVLNAQTQLFQTEAQLARARYDVLVGDLRLRQAAGDLKPQDLEPINRLVKK